MFGKLRRCSRRFRFIAALARTTLGRSGKADDGRSTVVPAHHWQRRALLLRLGLLLDVNPEVVHSHLNVVRHR